MEFQLYNDLLSPVAVVDQAMVVVYFNQAFAQFFRLPPRKIRGKRLDAVIGARDGLASRSAMDCLAAGAPVVTPEVEVAAGGDGKNVVLKFFPSGDGQVVVTVQDFSLERTLHARHRLQLDEIKRYSESLEVMVEARTTELREAKEQTESILRSIGEGILVVERNLRIGGQCSEAALALLARPTLAGLDVVEVLFPDVDRTGQAEERRKTRDFLASAFELCIPEQFGDAARFMSRQLRFPRPGGKLATYGLTMSPVVDAGQIVRIVIALRDDTEIEELRATAALVHRRVVEALGKTAGLRAQGRSPAYTTFLAEAAGLCADVEATLARTVRTGLTAEAVASLFRALHTVKGGARLYDLAFLQHFAHAAEATLDRVRTGRAELTAVGPIRDTLAEDVRLLTTGVDALRQLGAPAASHPGDAAPPGERLSAWNELCSALAAEASVLASALGKRATFTLHAEVELAGQDLQILSVVAVHLLRNALDHGVEIPGVREAFGKPPTGRVTLHLAVDGDFVRGRVADDGAGVDLAALARRAGVPQLGLAEALAVMATSGVSTKVEATEISGRGVGIDAIVKALRAAGGDLTLAETSAAGTVFGFAWRRSVAAGKEAA